MRDRGREREKERRCLDYRILLPASWFLSETQSGPSGFKQEKQAEHLRHDTVLMILMFLLNAAPKCDPALTD